MSKKRISRNAPCPCGSGKKYKHCCYGKGFEWVGDEDGAVAKSIPMTEEMTEVFHQIRQAFIDKHGREPGPDELLFTDLPHLEHLEAMMVGDMKAAGLDPAFIHAFEKTGILVSEENQHLIPEKDLDEWKSAVEEYRKKSSKRQKPVKYPMGTMAFYGPDNKTTTKIAAGVFRSENSEVIFKRWVATNVTTSPRIQQEIQDFFKEHGVTSVSMSDGNMGCPHEEGEDFPDGEDCPFCPFWKGKQGINQWF
jgi:SEC-C motif